MHLEIVIDKTSTAVDILQRLLKDKQKNRGKIAELMKEVEKLERENCVIENTEHSIEAGISEFYKCKRDEHEERHRQKERESRGKIGNNKYGERAMYAIYGGDKLVGANTVNYKIDGTKY